MSARRFTYRRLIELVGEEAAETLSREWGKRRLPQIPQFHVKRRERDRRIRAALDAGDSYRKVALTEGLSFARVKQIGDVV